ncbi:MAG: hypothetical protein IJV71_03390, partial [Lachnospiraceae bacterium]|nr:hypothetical protein [Lachnospiraceae bacterium]
MKKSIYLNFIIGYFVIAVLATVFIYYYITPRVAQYHVDEFGRDLYKQAYTISNNYSLAQYDITDKNYDYPRDLRILAYSTDTIIWLTDTDGKIQHSSNFAYNNF